MENTAVEDHIKYEAEEAQNMTEHVWLVHLHYPINLLANIGLIIISLNNNIRLHLTT